MKKRVPSRVRRSRRTTGPRGSTPPSDETEGSSSGRVPLEVKRILVGIDFSAGSVKALEYAAELAEQFQSYLHLLHVREPAPMGSDSETAGGMSGAEAAEEFRQRLIALARKQVSPLIPVKPHVTEGKAFEQIVVAAEELKVQLIVLAAHGDSGFKPALPGSPDAQRLAAHSAHERAGNRRGSDAARPGSNRFEGLSRLKAELQAKFFIGSTAEQVVRRAPCPVLIVREREHACVRPSKLAKERTDYES